MTAIYHYAIITLLPKFFPFHCVYALDTFTDRKITSTLLCCLDKASSSSLLWHHELPTPQVILITCLGIFSVPLYSAWDFLAACNCCSIPDLWAPAGNCFLSASLLRRTRKYYLFLIKCDIPIPMKVVTDVVQIIAFPVWCLSQNT